MNPQLQDFYARIARVQTDHARGYGFEAQGLLGRSHYGRKARRRPSLLKPLLVVFLSVMTLKAALYGEVGPETYNARVAELTVSQGLDRVGGYLMIADPATIWLSEKMTQYLPNL